MKIPPAETLFLWGFREAWLGFGEWNTMQSTGTFTPNSIPYLYVILFLFLFLFLTRTVRTGRIKTLMVLSTNLDSSTDKTT